MSRQVNFFLGPEDHLLIEHAIRSVGPVRFLKYRTSSPNAEELASVAIDRIGSDDLKIMVVRDVDLASISLTAAGSSGRFFCDVLTQPAIELMRCYSSGTVIRSGRLYMVEKFFKNDHEIFQKERSFVEWAGRVFKGCRAVLESGNDGYYFGPQALELRAHGLALEG